MLQSYDETWKYVVRLERNTPRRGEFIPYCIIDTLYNFLKSCGSESSIIDIGCGENNNKLFFPNIVGIDRTLEADIYAWQHDDAWKKLPQFDFGIAVNSLHWNDIGLNIKEALNKCNKLYITLNENQDISEWKHRSTWESYGNVEYFWHGQKEETKEIIREYLKNDQLYSWRSIDNLDDDVDNIFNKSVKMDPFFGVVRVIISKE